MGAVKELFMDAHERAIGLYLEKHPNATEAEAYDATADLAYDMMRDRMADMADMERARRKESKG